MPHPTRGPVTRRLVCPACREPFTAHGNRAITCSVACRNWARRYPGVRRDLRRSCEGCPALFMATHAAERYCTDKCRAAASKRRRRPGVREYVIATNCQACGSAMPAEKKAGSKYCDEVCGDRYYRAPGRFAERFGRTCERCGDPLPDGKRIDARFCRTTCQVLWNQELRRARRRGLPVEPIDRAAIFERDGMTCHLCTLPIDDRPTLDHLIPIALPGSPGHVWENVAAAHASCNSGKRDRVTEHDRQLHARLHAARWALAG